ncbi:MAG: HAMP domain-containing histidine kinase [Eubacteriaceae bacterium]|nr:HAMP domain-containing histidine kinase [Eubacteriaceae bacterium]
MKNKDKLLGNIVNSYKYSIKRRIWASYAIVYLIICIIILLTFAAAYGYNSCMQLAENTNVYADSIFEKAKRTSIYTDGFSRYLNLLVGGDGIKEIYIIDGDDSIISGSASASNNKNIAPVTGKNNSIFTDVFPHYARLDEKLYLDIVPFGYNAQEKPLLLVIAYSLDDVVENIRLIGRMLAATMLAGFLLFNVAGITRTDRMLRPIKEISEIAGRITAENTNLRIDEKTAKYELGELAETINEMVDRLRVSYSRQKRFVSDVSHELRTPIAVISGYGSMLKRWGKRDPEILDEGIDAIISESNNMKELVESLLFLTRSDNENIVYKMEQTNISEMVVSTVKEENMVHPDFDFAISAKEDVVTVSDATRLKQTLRILLDNAVKYSGDSKKIEVSLRTTKDNFTVSVRDYGIGISKEDLPNIFERFYRADTSRTKQTGGYGLGLAIARVIVTSHGGSLKVRSREGEGSEFSFTIPLMSENPEQPIPQSDK